VGRLAFGHASEAALHAYGVPRPAWLAGAAALGAGAALLATAGGQPAMPWALPLASAGAGAAFGGHWAVAAAALPELFGAPAFASIYAALQAAPALASVLLARGLAGTVYDRAAAAQGSPGGECVGGACFGPTLVALAGLQAVGAVMAGVLAWRARAKYRRLGAWLRLREAEEEGGM
jgi:MFS family permease